MSSLRNWRAGFTLSALLTFMLTSITPFAAQTPANRTSSDTGAATRFSYPTPRKGDQVDDYHGTKVADPYRWMEDPDSAETRAWVEAENKVTFGYLDQIPERAAIKNRLTALWNYERNGTPYKEGGRYFFTKNNGLQNQSVLYTSDSLAGQPRVLLDPNTLSTDGTIALAGTAVSDDGKYLAYGLSASGSDWEEWKVRDVATGKDTDDHLKWVKFSGASWSHDNQGFFYSRYDEPNEATKMEDANYNQKLYYHKLGTPQSDDQLIYQRPDHKDWGFGGRVTEDGHYLIISVWVGTENNNRLFYKDLQTPNSQVVELLNDFDAQYSFIDNDGPLFWFQTTLTSPRGRVIAIDINHPERANWKELIPQAAESLQYVNTVGNRFVANYLKDASTQVKEFALDGKLIRETRLPGIGEASGFGGKRADAETFYSFTSFTTPVTIYRYNVATGKSTVYRQPKVDFDPNAYDVKQVKYPSKDGTLVPMFIVYKKGIKLDGTNPTMLYGYGGFSISLTPYFSVSNLVWMEMGGVYAMPNLRGGAEYGEEWHLAGTKAKKQNVFDDFIAAAEWLIKNKYTSTPKLAISGGSNGGLLIGACLNQRPDLFGAALPAVGVMDMLRFQNFTIGWAWTSDYGSSANADEFKALFAYSPLHNIKPGTNYPATMVTTADHDDRVVPAHSFKYTATLQAAQAGPAPILIRIETKAGHGGGKPTTKQIEERADEYGFLVRELKMSPQLAKK
jgi:prolyl oligopeptidase